MKTYNLIALAFIGMLLFAMPFAVAEDTDSAVPADEQANPVLISADTSTLDQETVAEINDDLNESVSGLRIGWENAKLWFTFNNEKKATQELKIARLRLIQARIAAKNGNTEAVQTALEAHDRLLERVQERVNAIDGASDSESARLAAAKLVGLERAIEVHEARISKLNEIIASENLTEEQRTKIEARLAKVEENTAHLREVQTQKEEKVRTRLRAVSNMTEEEADSVIAELEDDEGLSEVRKLVAEVKIRNTERVMETLRERLAEAEEKGNNASGISNRLESMERTRNMVESEIQERQEAKSGKSE